MMNHPHRPNLPPMPERIRNLPVSPNGYPTPYFASVINGKPDFRVADTAKLIKCVKEHRCWVCGEPLGKFRAFVIGPMCSINRVSSEPPAHRECAMWSAVACPFLTLPKAVRRDAGMPTDTTVAGIMIERNPGVTLIWITTQYRSFQANGGLLFELGEPTAWHWFAMGHPATQQQVMESIASGLPQLQDIASEDGPEAVRDLAARTRAAMRFVPETEIVLA